MGNMINENQHRAKLPVVSGGSTSSFAPFILRSGQQTQNKHLTHLIFTTTLLPGV